MKRSIGNVRYSKVTRWSVLGLLIASTFVTNGCGPSQEELMMMSARRSRGDDDEPPPAPTPEPQQVVKQELEPAEPSAIVAKETSDKAEELEPDVDAGSDEKVKPVQELVSIEERKPKTSLSVDDRRARALDNLQKVSEALLAYARDHSWRLPKTYMEANGFRTLSWRVEILPYLGYEELYKKFDRTVPFDRPPNDELAQYIPDEYVSPERFDAKTNIMMPSRRGFIGGEGGQASLQDVEDGAPNTLLIVEANDKQAKTWTSPEDFAPSNADLARAGVVGLREDGAFAVWGNGWPVLLANELTGKHFWNAMTVEGGDGQTAGKVHRDIAVKNVTEAAVAATPNAETPSINANPPAVRAPSPQAATVQRDEVPKPVDLAAAQQKLKKLYIGKMAEAKDDDEKLSLSKEMLDASLKMDEDEAGSYALQTAAMRLAIEAGSVQQMLEGVDQRIGRFEVDAYVENKRWLLDFGKGVVKRDPETIDGMDYVRRAVKVLNAGVFDDDYLDASVIARYAYRFADQKRDEPIPKNLNRLKSLLGAAKRDFTAASDALQSFRVNPDDGEAAAEFGRFACFIKGDWDTGLRLLARGGPRALQEIAKLDMRGASDYTNQVAIADAWWDLAQKARTGVYKQSSRDRAVAWYRQAYPVMPDSLDRLHVKARLDEAKDEEPSSPLALINQLADDVGVDLSISLVAVANVGKRQQNASVANSGYDLDNDG